MAELKIYRRVVGMIQTNVYFILNEETKELVIADPADDAYALEADISSWGAKPVAIYLTHGHHDHIGAVNELKEKYGIPVVAYETEKALLCDTKANLSAFYGPLTVEPDVLVKDGDKLDYAGFECTVIHTPGHTAGSCCFYFPENKILISGDTLFKCSYGRTDLPTGSFTDLENSVRRLLSELPEDVTVCPGHMGFTTIEAEKRYNPLA
ncbi:MAG: MBL fold metallo-hydrolase [Lachnospiraceae bacterium]|nr:MBL fold metallo-hydrolase [Lachnospiraceae bacterium]